MKKTRAGSDNGVSRLLKACWKVVKKHCITIGIVLFCTFSSLYNFLPMYLSSTIEREALTILFVFVGVATVVLFLFAFLITFLTHREMRLNIDKEVIARLDEKLQCQSCMTEMLKIQTLLYNVELEEFIRTLSIEDIQKINLLVTSLASNDSAISVDEIEKVQSFINILMRVKESHEFAPYITLDDMNIIESKVEDKSTIYIISSSIACDDELKNTIINNLKRGVKYNYYFPRDEGLDISRDVKFMGLLNKFNENLELWKSDSAITDRIIQEQIACYWFSEEYMQMSMTFYDYQRVASGSKPTIVVKLPAINDDIARAYPLFFYIDSESNINELFCKALASISNKSSKGLFCNNPNSRRLEIAFEGTLE